MGFFLWDPASRILFWELIKQIDSPLKNLQGLFKHYLVKVIHIDMSCIKYDIPDEGLTCQKPGCIQISAFV